MTVSEIAYRASFFLYEIGFILFALVMAAQAGILRTLSRILQLPPIWGFPLAAAGLLFLCAGVHFYVYHALNPRYLASGAQNLLLTMYALKMFSMCSIFLAGAVFLAGTGWYLKSTT